MPLIGCILTAFDFDKLITYQERQQRIIVRINGNVERNKHVKENERVRHCTPLSHVPC